MGTFAELAERASRLAAALRALGARDGGRVAVLALNSDPFAELLPAVAWAGGVVVPLSVRWGPAEIRHALADCGADLLVVDDAFASLVPVLVEGGTGPRTVVHAGDQSPPVGVLGFEDLLNDAEPVDDAVSWRTSAASFVTQAPSSAVQADVASVPNAARVLSVGGGPSCPRRRPWVAGLAT